jgi:hypothetical protein
MTLTKEQCKLLLSIVNASIINASNSGIPIGKEYYDDIDEIKEKLNNEIREAILKEVGGMSFGINC